MIRRYSAIHDIDPNVTIVINGQTSETEKRFEGPTNDHDGYAYAAMLNAILTEAMGQSGVKNARIVGERVEIKVSPEPTSPWMDYMGLEEAIGALPVDALARIAAGGPAT